ncbi:MAG: hypothetical protein ABSB78_07150 [Bacteroidota bacterium]
MAVSKESRTAGIILISLGIIFLILNATELGWRHLWPLVMILGGIGFIVLYARDRKNFGVLMPASILIVIGVIFTVYAWLGWEYMNTLWPLFIAAPGIGFFAMYVFGPHDTGLLIPAFILTGIAGIFLLVIYDKGEYWPVLLILIGLTMIFRRRS